MNSVTQRAQTTAKGRKGNSNKKIFASTSRLLVLGLLSIAVMESTHAQFNPTAAAPKYRIHTAQTSPRGDLSAELMMLPPGQPADDTAPTYQHWVVDRKRRTARHLLRAGDFPSTVNFSPDEFIIALQAATGKNSSELQLFKRREGVHFEPVAGIDETLWDYCADRHPEAAGTLPAARRTKFIAWGSDSTSLLAALSAETPNGRVNEWLVACDVRKSSPTLDLNILNRGWPQTQNLPENALASLTFKADDRAFDRLRAAFTLLTQPNGGVETLTQPGDEPAPDPEPFAGETPAATPAPNPPALQRQRASPDGTALLYSLNSRAAPAQPVKLWFCIFDMTSGRPTMDLAVINRGGIKGNAKLRTMNTDRN